MKIQTFFYLIKIIFDTLLKYKFIIFIIQFHWVKDPNEKTQNPQKIRYWWKLSDIDFWSL